MKLKIKNVKPNWKLFTLANDRNMTVSFLNFGGIITEINVPNREQTIENVVLGFKSYADYEKNTHFLGGIIGRIAGRIQDASFTLGNQTFTLDANAGNHHLHGGPGGFHQVLWKDKPFQTDDTVGVVLTYTSPDGEGGYPANIEVTVVYTLNNKNEFIIDYSATTDQTTVLTMTNHSYFNLSGNLSSTIHNHHVMIDSDEFVELDKELIPTGKKVHVMNTPFDFRNGRKLADGINSKFIQNMVVNNGYDHYFIFNHQKQENIVVRDETSGRKMTIKTNQPGAVMYTANSLDDNLALANGKSKPYVGVCFETQASPASLHHKGFPTVTLNAQETYKKQTVFAFGLVE
ncbi:aldose epimerase family protein [Psychrobacillus sp. L4]|uniref:aldose epimerase family protein n=1 Tax=Psychrobacillus sp. L4 TaxID=3236892 RepID=UPI0036F26D0E